MDAKTDPATLYWHDLYVDLIGLPDGSYTIRDEDELEESGIKEADPELYSLILAARDELIRLFQVREYPFHDRTVTITTCGRICIGRRKINLSQVFAGQNVGIKEVAEKIWLVSFMHYDLGFFDHEAGRVECAPNPFGAKVLPMSPERSGYHVPR
jgi:hypothetical protein